MLRIRDWEKLQHYKDRNPPWIKLHTDLLDSYEFGKLPDSSKWLFCGLCLLASRMANRVPSEDLNWLANRLSCTEDIDLEPLLEGGWIEYVAPDAPDETISPWPSRIVSPALQSEILKRDEFRCQNCGCQEDLEIDHIIPVSRGGESKADNLQVLCRPCNRAKSNKITRYGKCSKPLQKAEPSRARESRAEAEQSRGREREEQKNGFSEFWDSYPRKTAKAAAEKAWRRLKPSESLKEEMLTALERQKTWRQWADKQFVPHPATWINGRRWEDERPKSRDPMDEARAQIERLSQ